MRGLHDLRVKLFADGADLAGIAALAGQALIKGFTTNPTLMRKAGVTDYAAFAKAVIKAIPDLLSLPAILAPQRRYLEAVGLAVGAARHPEIVLQRIGVNFGLYRARHENCLTARIFDKCE